MLFVTPSLARCSLCDAARAFVCCLTRLTVCCRNEVPPFGPQLTNPNVFSDPAQLRQFMLTKCTLPPRSCTTHERALI